MIPKPMRDQLGLEPGDRVSFLLEDGAVRVAAVGGNADCHCGADLRDWA